jgi:Mor family transcriptional regulator
MKVEIDIEEYKYAIMQSVQEASKAQYLYDHEDMLPEDPKLFSVEKLIEVMVENYCTITIEKIRKSVVFPEPKVATE